MLVACKLTFAVTNVDLLEIAVSTDLSRLLDRGAAEAEQGHDEIIKAVGVTIAADQAGRLGDVVLLAHLVVTISGVGEKNGAQGMRTLKRT